LIDGLYYLMNLQPDRPSILRKNIVIYYLLYLPTHNSVQLKCYLFFGV